MKFTLWATALIVIAGTVLAGCSKSEEAPAEPTATPKAAPAEGATGAGTDPNAASGTAPAEGGGGGEMVATPKPLTEGGK